MDGYTAMSITSAGPSTLANQKAPVRVFAERNVNQCNDIEGATASIPYAEKYNKPADLGFIHGSTPKSSTHTRNVQDLSLFIDDIDGTRHSIKDRMMRTKRHVNPLVPEYPLPSYVPSDIPEPKFIRDTLSIRDIDGAFPKSARTFTPKETMRTNDIVGAQACFRPAYRRARLDNAPHDIMNNGNIVLKHTRFQDRCVRDTNLMDPVYQVNGIEIKDEAKSKPKPLKNFIPDNNLLGTHDIAGAYPGWGQRERREIRNIMSTMDIPGAQADTIVHSMKSERITNPLTPVYASLDGAPLQPLVMPLMPASFVEKPTHSLKNPAPTIPVAISAPVSGPATNSSRRGSRDIVPKLPLRPQSESEIKYSARSYADKADSANVFT